MKHNPHQVYHSATFTMYINILSTLLGNINIKMKRRGPTLNEFKILLRFFMTEEMRRQIWLFDQQDTNTI